MNYQVKRLIGTIFMTFLAIFVWALITGTAHAQVAQSRAVIFSTPQLVRALDPIALRCASARIMTAPECLALDDALTVLTDRDVIHDPNLPTIDKLRVILIALDVCLRAHTCVRDDVMNSAAFALVVSRAGISRDAYFQAYEAYYGDLHAIAPVAGIFADRLYGALRRDD